MAFTKVGSQCIRWLHVTHSIQSINKNALSKLRKKTGFPYINCKKALENFENDVAKAEGWLREQAQKEGWAKASKLGHRPMSSGLIGIQLSDGVAAMVEVNCETDFVARNAEFQGLVEKATSVCLNAGKKSQKKISWRKEEMQKLEDEGGKTLADLVALSIGSVGENIALRRATCLTAPEGLHIGYYTHAIGAHVSISKIPMGRYASLVLFERKPPLKSGIPQQISPLSHSELGRQLAQHVVGMNPRSLGDPKDRPARTPAEDSRPPSPSGAAEIAVVCSPDSDVRNSDSGIDFQPEEAQSEVHSEAARVEAPPETRLIFQEFVLQSDLTVEEFLEEQSAKVLDFVRYECGESLLEDDV